MRRTLVRQNQIGDSPKEWQTPGLSYAFDKIKQIQ